MSTRNSESDVQQPHDDAARPGVQAHVNAHFDATASYWDGVYRGESLQGVIYHQRQSAVLECVAAVDLPQDASVLEIGCGAGHLTLELARRGLRVEAVDASEAMIETTATQARDAGLAAQVRAGLADVHALPFESNHFDLVVAVGLIPWLHSPGGAIAEMARVLRPGGQLILTADNRARLITFTDPRAMLAVSPLKRAQVALRQRRGLATSRLDFPRQIDRLLLERGLRPVTRRTVGFGPLSFLGRPVFREPRSLRINARLQALADRGVPGLRWTGWHYVIRAAKDLAE
jgi:ubiquinone/menaquinone biosynthesis C-methylase UbiE